jgi:integrase
MLALSGRSTVDWPKAPTPERKVREPVKEAEVEACLSALLSRGWEDTANLIRFMRDTGARVHVEALYGTLSTDGKRLTIRDGKGGHERVIPFRDNVPAFGGLTYEGHLRRIKEVTHLRPHDLRRYFITKVYERSGKDLRMAQVLAGHADPTTTARYIGVSLEDMERALSAPPSG